MKLTKEKVKKHARKIRNATEEELKELQEGYEKLLANVRGMDSPMLLIVAVIGIAIVLLFKSGIFDFIGLLILIYALYLFVQKGGHQEGYYEGYYDRMTKGGGEQGGKAAGGSGK